MSSFIARLISWILNPVVLLIFVPYFLVLRETANSNAALGWTIYTIVVLTVFTSLILIARQKNLITDLDVSHRNQRPLLFLIAMAFALAYTIGVALVHGPFILIVVGLGSVVSIGCAAIINMKIKASIHTAVISAIVFALVLAYGGEWSILLLVIPLMSWARVKIKRHTIAETIVGAVLGSLLSLSIYSLLRLFGHHA